MNKKIITIVLAAVIIGAFFLPYFNLGGLFKMSGLDLVTGKGMGEGESSGSADRYVMLLAPLAGLLLLAGALSNNKYILGRPFLGFLALAGVLYPIIRTLIEGKGEGMGQMFKFMGIGFWLGLVAALAVLVYNPKS
jgi:hypothetical protein